MALTLTNGTGSFAVADGATLSVNGTAMLASVRASPARATSP